MTIQPQTERETETPPDGYGAGFLTYQLASTFHALRCLIGAEEARQEMAEIINAEFEGRRQ